MLTGLNNYKYLYQNSFCLKKQNENPVPMPKKAKEVSFKGLFDGIKPEFFRSFLPAAKNTAVNFITKQTAQTPLSSLVPNYEPLECDFCNIDEFSKLYCDKVDSQLMPVSKEDVKNLINRLKEKTNAPDDLIKEVLYKLTYYSSYNSLDRIQVLVDKYAIGSFGCKATIYNDGICDYSSNALLNYIGKQKAQLNLFTEDGAKKGVVLDNETILTLKKFKNSSDILARDEYAVFIKDIEDGKIKFFNIPGWDVKNSHGQYKNANLFYGSSALENLALDTIKRVQKGQNLDDILYSDLSQRLYEVIGEDLNTKIPMTKVRIKRQSFSTDDICKNLKINTLNPDDIKELITAYFRLDDPRAKMKPSKEELARILKYIDKVTFVFSPDSFALALKKLNEKIQSELNNEECIYVIPNANKSFVYVTNVFAKVNNINLDNIVGDLLSDEWKAKGFKGKHKIILDDISASGKTQRSTVYNLNERLKSSDGAYASILTSKCSREENCNTNLKTKISTKIPAVALYNFNDVSSSSEYNEYEAVGSYLISNGYDSISSACAFPYMIPDSNSDFTSMLFSTLLYRNTSEANKGLNLASILSAPGHMKYTLET